LHRSSRFQNRGLNCLRRAEHRAPFGCPSESLPAADDQLGANAILERGEASADGGAVHSESAGGPGDRAPAREREHDLEVIPIWFRHLLPSSSCADRRMGSTGGHEGGVSDHGFIHSIYFRDPNGYVVELCTKGSPAEASTNRAGGDARLRLEQWTSSRSEAGR